MANGKSNPIVTAVTAMVAATVGVAAGVATVLLSDPKNRQKFSKTAKVAVKELKKEGSKGGKQLQGKIKDFKKAVNEEIEKITD
jgi:hypothetical protein